MEKKRNCSVFMLYEKCTMLLWLADMGERWYYCQKVLLGKYQIDKDRLWALQEHGWEFSKNPFGATAT